MSTKFNRRTYLFSLSSQALRWEEWKADWRREVYYCQHPWYHCTGNGNSSESRHSPNRSRLKTLQKADFNSLLWTDKRKQFSIKIRNPSDMKFQLNFEACPQRSFYWKISDVDETRPMREGSCFMMRKNGPEKLLCRASSLFLKRDVLVTIGAASDLVESHLVSSSKTTLMDF